MTGSLHCTGFFLEQGLDWENPIRSGETALELSAKNRSIEQFRYLITKIKPNLDRENKKGQTLLHLAVQANNLSHVALLIDQGADFDKQDAQGKTPLFVAAQHNHRQIVELLMLCDADPDLKIEFTEQTPDDVATPEGKKIISQMRAFKIQAPAEGTPLHIAVTTENYLAVRLLARHVNIDKQNSKGRTALHEAVRYGKLQNVRELVTRGANITLKDANGKSALDLARQEAHSAIEHLLLQAINKNNNQ
jgi:ankyrin